MKKILIAGLTAATTLSCLAAKPDWDPISKEDFREVIKGRCPVIWTINPNDPSYDALVREKAASGINAVISPEYLTQSFFFMEGGLMERWQHKYRGSMLESMGWGPIRKPPMDIPLKDFPQRYIRDFTEEHLKQIVKDHLFLFSFASGITSSNSLAMAKKCREALGNKFIVFRKLEGTIGKWYVVYDFEAQAKRDPNKIKDYFVKEPSIDECFEFWKKYIVRIGEQWPDHFGEGTSTIENMQVVDILDMDRWDTEYAHGPCQIHMAFSRGAKSQYDIPLLVFIAGFNTTDDGLWARHLAEGTPYERYYRYGVAAGGKPAHLLNRIHWAVWFHDADTIIGESNSYWCFVKGRNEQHFDLSPLGEDLKKLYKFADTDFFNRGRMHVPACILLDYKYGWQPGYVPDAHSWDPPGFPRRRLYGMIPYRKKEYMIDNFFGAVFPGYEKSGSWGNTLGGELCPTPYGDSFDVLLSNAKTDVLKKYPVLFPLGLEEMPEGLQEKLVKYVQDGGTLVLDSVLMNEQWKQLTGIKMTEWNWPGYYEDAPGYLLVSDHSQWKDETPQEEHRYFYYMIDGVPDKAEVLAMNPERNHPLIVKCPVGKGTVYYTAIQHMQESSGVYRPYGLTKVCKKLIADVLRPHQKVFVEGDPIQYIVRTSGDKLLVMAVNNQPEDWTGKLSLVPLKNAETYKLQEWYVTGEPVDVEHEMTEDRVMFSDTIPAHSLKLYTLE